MAKKHLKFGIISDTLKIKKWQLNTIKQLLELKNVECSLVIFKGKKNKASFDEYDKGFQLKHTLWWLHSLIFGKESSATKNVDFPVWLARTDHLKCSIPKNRKSAESFKKEDIERIKSRNLDFILNFSARTICGEILETAQYGIWSFQHRDAQKYSGGPPCFWEIYNKDNITGAVLKKITDKPNVGIILKKGFIRTSSSYKKSLNQLCMESSRWPAQVCIDIIQKQTKKFFSEPVISTASAYSKPTNTQFLVFLYISLVAGIKDLFNKLFYVDYWNIGIAKTTIGNFLNDDKPEVEWFPLHTKKKFVADPFAFVDPTDKDKLHIFFETYPFKENKGIIEYCTHEKSFDPEMHTILNKDYHLSYPHILYYKGDIYMVPETFENNNISIYKATDFPHKWKEEATLIENFKGIDSTIIKHGGMWWLFTSDNADGPHYNLQLFYSDDLLTGWTPHPKNPVKTDIRSSRSAGTPFEYEGSLIRPSMDYSQKIEGRIVLNKILKLSKTEFEEVSIKTIEPYEDSYFSDKIHTLAAAGNYTIVDGCRECFIFSDINFLKSKLKLIKKRIVICT